MKKWKNLPVWRKFVTVLNNKCPVFVAKLRFKKMFGRKLDLKNPKDLNEKILWLSLCSDTTEWSRLTDKYAVRDYVKSKGLEDILVELYGRWDIADDIDWESLPNSFVLKTNNGSGTIIIVPDKSSVDEIEIKDRLNKMMVIDNSSSTTEFHYHRIKPCIIAEQYLNFKEDVNESTSAIDYKIWVFNGKAYYVWACKNRNVGVSADVAMFDREWNYHPEKSIYTEHYRKQDPLVKKPQNLDRMLEIAEILGDNFPEVRVDLYNINGRIYFGELTFTSLGGTMDFYTQDCLYEMGSYVDLSSAKRIR